MERGEGGRGEKGEKKVGMQPEMTHSFVNSLVPGKPHHITKNSNIYLE